MTDLMVGGTVLFGLFGLALVFVTTVWFALI